MQVYKSQLHKKKDKSYKKKKLGRRVRRTKRYGSVPRFYPRRYGMHGRYNYNARVIGSLPQAGGLLRRTAQAVRDINTIYNAGKPVAKQLGPLGKFLTVPYYAMLAAAAKKATSQSRAIV